VEFDVYESDKNKDSNVVNNKVGGCSLLIFHAFITHMSE